MNHLSVLPSDNPCSGCKLSCCDPVNVGFEFELSLPPGSSEHSSPRTFQERIWQSDLAAIRRQIEARLSESVHLAENPRFSVDGYYLWVPDRDPIAVQKQGVSVPGVLIHVVIFIRCAVYDATTGLCTDYPNRPSLCRDLSPETCGRSHLYPNMPDGRPWPPLRQMIALNRRSLKNKKPTLDAAISDLIFALTHPF